MTCEGYEADDILGTFAAACENSGNECVIATGDRDSLQLVSDKTHVHLCTNRDDILYTPGKIREDYGVTPAELIEIKAIQGDSSDNIPGVAGIGPKGAGDLIQRYHSVAYIYDHLDELDIKPGVRKKLAASKDNALLSRMLGEIVKDAPIDTELEHYRVIMRDRAACARYMARLELFSLIDKYDLEVSPDAAEAAAETANADALAAAKAEYMPLRKLLLLHRDFYRLLRNFVTLEDFYDTKQGIVASFQCGTLIIDQRACHLTLIAKELPKLDAQATKINASLDRAAAEAE